MKFIGNIVYEKSIVVDTKIKVVPSIDDIIDGIPTLIIGVDKIKTMFPDSFNIYEKQIKENIYWTFTLIENRNEYERDINNFIQYCYENLVYDIDYVFIDPVQYKSFTIKKIINKIKSSNKVIPYQYRNQLYIYTDKVIFGVDLYLLERFFNIKPESIKDKIKILSNGLFLDSDILIKYKDYLDKLNSPKFIPYLYSIENE